MNMTSKSVPSGTLPNECQTTYSQKNIVHNEDDETFVKQSECSSGLNLRSRHISYGSSLEKFDKTKCIPVSKLPKPCPGSAEKSYNNFETMLKDIHQQICELTVKFSDFRTHEHTKTQAVSQEKETLLHKNKILQVQNETLQKKVKDLTAELNDSKSRERELSEQCKHNWKLVSDLTNELHSKSWSQHLNQKSDDAKTTLLVGSSIIKDIQEENLIKTNVICKRGGKIKDVTEVITGINGRFDEVTILVGGNDCEGNGNDDDIVKKVMTDYSELIECTKEKSLKVNISSIIPRNKQNVKTRIKEANSKLETMCAGMDVCKLHRSKQTFLSLPWRNK